MRIINASPPPQTPKQPTYPPKTPWGIKPKRTRQTLRTSRIYPYIIPSSVWWPVMVSPQTGRFQTHISPPPLFPNRIAQKKRTKEIITSSPPPPSHLNHHPPRHTHHPHHPLLLLLFLPPNHPLLLRPHLPLITSRRRRTMQARLPLLLQPLLPLLLPLHPLPQRQRRPPRRPPNARRKPLNAPLFVIVSSCRRGAGCPFSPGRSPTVTWGSRKEHQMRRPVTARQAVVVRPYPIPKPMPAERGVREGPHTVHVRSHPGGR